jgi:hypothetical protein
MFKSVPAVEDIVFPSMVMLSTASAVRVPTEVMAVWAACVTVRAVPLALPVTSPVMSPTKAVLVIEVAPVTTPASITMAPSRTIC